MESRMSAHDAAFDAGVDDNDDNETVFAPSQYLEDKSSDVAATVEAEDWEAQANRRLSHAFGKSRRA